MERVIIERLSFYMESRGILSPHQSGCGREPRTVKCLETENRKAQAHKRGSFFFDVEKQMRWFGLRGLMVN